MEEEQKIHAPFVLQHVLQHVLMLVDFPAHLCRLRLVNKDWNQAALKGLGAQIMSYDVQIEKLNKELAEMSDTPHYAKLIKEYNALKSKKKVPIKAKDLVELIAFASPPAAITDTLGLGHFVLKKSFSTWNEIKLIVKSKDFISSLRASELNEEQYQKATQYIKAKNLQKDKLKAYSLTTSLIFGIIEDKLKDFEFKKLKLAEISALDSKIKQLTKKRDTAIELIKKNN